MKHLSFLPRSLATRNPILGCICIGCSRKQVYSVVLRVLFPTVGRSEISRLARFSGLYPYLTAVYTEPLPFLQLRSVFDCWSFTLPAINRASGSWHLRKG